MLSYDALIGIARGFQESRILLTAVELDLFTTVGDGATAREVAARLATGPRATEALLNALAAMEVLEKRDGRFRCGPAAARYLAGSSPDNERTALMHTVHLWDRWSRLTDCVRADTAVAGDGISERGDMWIEAFIAAMHRNAVQRAPHVVEAVGAGGVTRMLDVGGGSGAYSIAFAEANPALYAEILDLPPVLAIAEGHIRDTGLARRVTTRAGDLRIDSLGSGFDLIFVSAICHMLGPEENRSLLDRCLEALSPGGRIVIQDFILEPDKTAPRVAAIFALNMLVGTPHGSSYSEEEYAAWMKEAGFDGIRRVRLKGPTGLMVAVRN